MGNVGFIRKIGKADPIMMNASTYLSACKVLLSLSGSAQYRIFNDRRNKVIKSMYNPKGQIQPQKNLPKKRVAPRMVNMIRHFPTPVMAM